MTPIAPVSAAGAAPTGVTAPPLSASVLSASAPQQGVAVTRFSDLLGKGLDHVEHKLTEADDLVRAFALDDSVPIHQVTIALEEARIAVELAMQVRSHLVEAYHQIMNTQL